MARLQAMEKEVANLQAANTEATRRLANEEEKSMQTILQHFEDTQELRSQNDRITDYGPLAPSYVEKRCREDFRLRVETWGKGRSGDVERVHMFVGNVHKVGLGNIYPTL